MEDHIEAAPEHLQTVLLQFEDQTKLHTCRFVSFGTYEYYPSRSEITKHLLTCFQGWVYM